MTSSPTDLYKQHLERAIDITDRIQGALDSGNLLELDSLTEEMRQLNSEIRANTERINALRRGWDGDN